ncbi:MAG: hypothetical protein CMM48_03515 [Rhodospirillaceae bacterium]|nr:hypothetical protein [Rhodospirillaceae bacterium]HAA93583.1 hypothetical protein [Rhodospirillaceae bacterium]
MKILSIIALSDDEQAKIRAIDPSIELTMAPGWFDGEFRDSWPAFCTESYLPPDAHGHGTRDERDALLAEAEIVFAGWPYPTDLRSRTPNLKWFHQQPAGANNLIKSDLWRSDVIVTTSRGYGNTLGIAEFAIGGLLYFAKSAHFAVRDRANGQFHKPDYTSLLLQDKTLCVIGAGGIGAHVGRLAAGLGMRAVGTKRQPNSDLPEGFAEIRPPDGLQELLSESHFVAVCCQWTPETDGIMDEAAFAAMKPDGVISNIARGEIVDEDAMLNALDSGHLRGAALDCYVGEFEHPPSERLWQHPKILITPHCSGKSDVSLRRHTDVFCKNLRALLDGQPMINRIDWETGY